MANPVAAGPEDTRRQKLAERRDEDSSEHGEGCTWSRVQKQSRANEPKLDCD